MKHKLGFMNMFSVNLVARRCGLVMFWHSEDKVEVANYSNHHIHLKDQSSTSSESWFITKFYGYLETSK